MGYLRNLNLGILLSCVIGIGLSMYALSVEVAKEYDDNYEAMCDISEHISCTKAFMSEYGKGFGIIGGLLGEDSILNQPNSIFGIIFYSLISLLSLYDTIQGTKVMIILNILSNINSVYLAYLLYFILYDFCVICVSTYVVNFVNLVLSVKKLSHLKNNIKINKMKKN